MTEPSSSPWITAYSTLPPGDWPAKYLVADESGGTPLRFPFHARIEIGRYKEGWTPAPGVLRVDDPTVSSRHCIITQSLDGRCFIRDVSRNGTRVDGRRLVPNVESELRVGQTVSVGRGHTLRLDGEGPAPRVRRTSRVNVGTLAEPTQAEVTVLVGDIRDYTLLVQVASPQELQESVDRLFQALEEAVEAHGGTVKEYPGDAIYAFWENGWSESSAIRACRAALALRDLAGLLAREATVWRVPQFPLRMKWALATGPVILHSVGGAHPTGLMMLGEAPVRAFRIEKLADDDTGPIVTCPKTRELAAAAFDFRDLGERTLKGFEAPEHVFGLVGAK